MNFIQAYEHGKKGGNKGFPTGMSKLNKAIGGVQRKSIYGLAAAPKVGKTTLADYAFVIMPVLHALENNLPLKYIYFSYEIDRVKKQFDFAAFFFHYDYQIEKFEYEGVEYPISSSYLLGKLQDNNENQILVLPEHETILMEIYQNRIIPMFGEYDSDNKRIKEGIIDFYDVRDNPTGMQKIVIEYAKKYGDFKYETYKTLSGQTKKYPIAYKLHNEDHFTMIITDHIRKLKRERGFSLKQNMDKWIEYSVDFRNLCHFSFLHIVHLNRAISNVDRLKYNGEYVYPTGDDVKDSGNLSEECDFLLTMMNPADEKYGLDKHFGVKLSDYPKYRSIHLVESRDTECPLHLKTQMSGAQKYFKQI